MKYILSAIVLFLAVESEAGAPVETPTMGWSSWNAFRVNISEGLIKKQNRPRRCRCQLLVDVLALSS